MFHGFQMEDMNEIEGAAMPSTFGKVDPNGN